MRRMISAVELFIGLRYLRARRRTRFVSFITFISLAGIALGVAALIVILSVMNGFEAELRTRLLSMNAHGYVTGEDGRVEDWQAIRETMLESPGVAAVAPVIEMEGMLRKGSRLTAVLVEGVRPGLQQALSSDTVHFIDGGLRALDPGAKAILLGRILAYDLGVWVGDSVTLLVPRPAGGGTVEPLLESFVVRGVFEAGIQEHDASLAILHLEDAARLLSYGDAVTAVRFRAHDVMAAPEVSQAMARALGPGYRASDWTLENASYFRAIRLEKMMMSLILSLIIGVAAFNIVASLVMVVTDKTGEIAILRTLGMGPGNVVRVFFVQGAAIGWLGVIAGVIGGVLLAVNVPTLVPLLERAFGFQIMPGDVYYVTRIPSIVEAGNVVVIAVAALLLTSLATLYPARRAAQVNPAVALRYE
jgi:lipoprotein-releasing system permease protein